MTSARCPACGAAIAAGAPWCTLCYADLRPRTPETVPPTAAVAPAAVAASEPAPAPAAAVATLAPEAPVDEPVATHADATRQTRSGWPCHVCGSLVALEQDACPQCGSGFLAGVDPAGSMQLPLVGDPRSLSSTGRLGVVVVGAAAVTVLLLFVLIVLGQFA